MQSDLHTSRQQIRNQIRHARRALSDEQQAQAATDIVRHAEALLPQKQLTIALYLSNDGELSTTPLIEKLWQLGHRVVLPVLHPFSKGHLLFLRYTPDSPMQQNRYGISEPKLASHQVVPLAEIDLILTPLVAFDPSGNRLGMGGGYYDRTLAGWSQIRPDGQAIGLAHDCQQVAALPCESWDVPLHKILTPGKVWQWESPD